DLDDLWAGREAADTGKRVSLQPRLSLTFDRGVDPDRLATALTLTGEASTLGGRAGDCTGARVGGPFAPYVIKPTLTVAARWGATVADLPGQPYPRNFSALVFGSLSGHPNIEGPI